MDSSFVGITEVPLRLIQPDGKIKMKILCGIFSKKIVLEKGKLQPANSLLLSGSYSKPVWFSMGLTIELIINHSINFNEFF
jgi:hypothetical protein